MPIDTDAARRFVLANSRLIDRHRMAFLLDGAPAARVITALRAYRNPDGGFGHALEPDIRAPESEPAAAVEALRLLAGLGALDDPMVPDLAAWVSTVAEPDGGVPFMLPTAADSPHAPFLSPAPGSSFLTYALAGALWQARSDEPWLARATEWSWAGLEAGGLGAYGVKCALEFLDAVPDEAQAREALERLREHIQPDGSMPVTGGTEDERLTALVLSPHPGARSRTLFTAEQIEAGLDELEQGQQDDGGWTFDWVAWAEGQSVDARSAMTLHALTVLRAHERI
jgi:hypothetical protein